ncbi:MAG TPA: 4-oxalocrotonate tautomerase [Gammaproteobacteria bacterium]|jgi:4-oxalocrotonate tautomerase|uniref:tautomerase family protein n=1 Tax=Immundisolibacter sp. TaxID=1934948 RepID=UPI000E809B99|nr:4-oxalocrotonate tautomerase [Gammaproteobacteria bacterium]HCZ49539.1 4-oxalocrotonate tautomerase [Gammaproteobacteria bacterium]MCH78977.1 4-oxalocrotonate tautomerase [Gammaproteobacteria bacterium]
MPFIQVNILEGRTEEQKLGLIRELTETACRVLGSKPEQVRVLINDVPNTNWGIAGQSAKELGR